MCFGSLCSDDSEERPNVQETKPAIYSRPPPPPPQMIGPSTANGSLSEYHKITKTAIDVFLCSQKDDGEMGGIGYWQTGNAYNTILLHDAFAGGNVCIEKIVPALSKVRSRVPNFINEFNDDTLWWAHCLLALLPFVRGSNEEPAVLRDLDVIWQHVARYQLPPGQFLNGDKSHDMAGAVLWTSKPGEEQVNSITTSLFAALSARLAVLLFPSTPQDPGQLASHRYLAAAEAAVSWIFRECYREDDKVVLDGIKIRSGERVDWTFSYTTAATIGALTDLSGAYMSIPSWQKQQHARSELAKACDLAQASMHRDQWVDPESGILTEKGAYGKGTHDPWQNNDAVGFKSVLVRDLCHLRQAIVHDRNGNGQEFMTIADEIKEFVTRQFHALQEKDTNGQGQYGPWWDGPFEAPTGHSQLAILDVMAGIHSVNSG